MVEREKMMMMTTTTVGTVGAELLGFHTVEGAGAMVMMKRKNTNSLAILEGDNMVRIAQCKPGLVKQTKNQRKDVNIFLHFSFNICFGCSKEPSH